MSSTSTPGAVRRPSRRVRLSAVAGAAGLALALAIAGPASGLGSVQKTCVDGSTVYGNSNSIGATSVVGGLDQCEAAGAQYRYWSDGVVRYSSWWWSHSTAYAPGPTGSIGLGGRHSVEWPALIYQYQFPFTT